ncbi:Cytochrome c1 [Rhodovastum atsumiense]|uniref:Cytochrome c1 n=1 Tax=Rhodovastum atsumiense TaxID=504468 RepID=A0A5M6ILB5_9PROT|nr:cytochrome c1 [Rhodovastum atsumiense]KAA5608415.1 cytochrome c1 [Rhodovastum atsumiense]CAH2599392.1 Cytochrome c1 [Rhodovastum atsumiense]
MRTLRFAALFGAALLAAPLAMTPARASEGGAELPNVNWSFGGLFGSFDRASAQRGFQVYNNVCSACHSLKQAYYRNLTGIGLTDEQVKMIAANKTVPTLKDDGSVGERPALPSDHFRSPFPNDLAARAANNGALPPDLSVIVKAREGGANYVYGVLTGYADPPAGFKLMDGMNYNHFFPGNQIGMPQPLRDDTVEYTDGTKPTLDQQARDVVTFLAFIANPELEERHRMGVKVVLFLLLLTGLSYSVKRKLWAGVH